MNWKNFQQSYYFNRELGFALDYSQMGCSAGLINQYQSLIDRAVTDMTLLEKGEIANPDENRMVGHYWLRNAQLAPNVELAEEIQSTLSKIKKFKEAIHSGSIRSESGDKFQSLLLVGIGGSALGPQFVSRALGLAGDPMKVFFFDNTDPDGMQNVLDNIPDLSKTLCIIISKSGGTKETRNGEWIAKAAWSAQELSFAKHAIAITQKGSALSKRAEEEGWLAEFPMWDWVGGRTSVLSAVGLLPAALQGLDIDRLLTGAAEMDVATRSADLRDNPALLLALMWYFAGAGKGEKNMVVLPYKDRLELFSRYLQQLIMESLGKERDLDGNVVNQGITVYGNKGSTDQHAYVQHLRDGLNDFFVVFINVLNDKISRSAGENVAKFDASDVKVENCFKSGDYLSGFYLGTRTALSGNNRQNLTITIDSVSDYSVGGLIALFERAVGFYASMINVNAYHQPGVEAGKVAASQVLAFSDKITACLNDSKERLSVELIAQKIGAEGQEDIVFNILRRLAANGLISCVPSDSVFFDLYGSR